MVLRSEYLPGLWGPRRRLQESGPAAGQTADPALVGEKSVRYKQGLPVLLYLNFFYGLG